MRHNDGQRYLIKLFNGDYIDAAYDETHYANNDERSEYEKLCEVFLKKYTDDHLQRDFMRTIEALVFEESQKHQHAFYNGIRHDAKMLAALLDLDV